VTDPREFTRVLEAEIHPDDSRHAAIGRRPLRFIADTPDRQACPRAACQGLNQRVAGAYREHRTRVDRGQ